MRAVLGHQSPAPLGEEGQVEGAARVLAERGTRTVLEEDPPPVSVQGRDDRDAGRPDDAVEQVILPAYVTL